MPIVLSEIRTAVQTYLNTKVNIAISAVAPDVPGTLNPNEEGTFKVDITNAAAAASGVRLENVRYHLSASPADKLKLKVPAAATATARSGAEPTSTMLAPGTFVSSMFLFPADNSLDVGDSDTLNSLKIKAFALGNASISCDIHADVDLDHLFPKNENSAAANRTVSIV